MKKGNGMLWVFILNLTFSMLELMGGVLTGSTAILSDGVHDLGDAVSVGVAYAFERKSKKAPDERYTYGYARYSAVGGLVTVAVLLLGSLVAVGNAIYRLINPAEIDHGGMIAFAVVGLCVNLFSALLMHRGESLNRRAVRLHVLEDVLGWAVVLVAKRASACSNVNCCSCCMFSSAMFVSYFFAASRERAATELLFDCSRQFAVCQPYAYVLPCVCFVYRG